MGQRQDGGRSGPVVERKRRGVQEARRDRQVLGWVGRFRVVSSAELALRFGVSEQQTNVRIRRLLEAGLLGVHREGLGLRRLVYLTRKGAGRVGLPLRRPPGRELDIDRELSLATLVVHLELLGTSVLTHREARRDAQLSVHDDHGPRWPDLVVVREGRPVAVEFEQALKPKKRQQGIVASYEFSMNFDETWFIVRPGYAAERMQHLIQFRKGLHVVTYHHDHSPQIARTLAGAHPLLAEERSTAQGESSAAAALPTASYTEEEWGDDGPDWEVLLHG